MKAVTFAASAALLTVAAADGWQDHKPSDPVVLTSTTEARTWEDVKTTTTPAIETSTTSYPAYWGDETLSTTTTSSTTTTAKPWKPTKPVDGGEKDPHTWSDYVEPPKETPVHGGNGNGDDSWKNVPSGDNGNGNGDESWKNVPSGGNGNGDESWKNVPSGGDGVNSWENVPVESTITLTGTKTATIWEEVNKPTEPAGGNGNGNANTWADAGNNGNGNTWVDVSTPVISTATASSSWAAWVSSTPVAAESCVITVLTHYGAPTWNPTPDASVPATWAEASVPAVSTSSVWGDNGVPASSSSVWGDNGVPASSSSVWGDNGIPASSSAWVNIPAVPTTSAPATWADNSVPAVPTSSVPATWADNNGEGCGASTTTVYHDVTVTVTAQWEDSTNAPVDGGKQDPETWKNVPIIVTSTTSADAEHTWENVPIVKTTTSSAAEHTWSDVIETTTSTKTKHTWTKPTTTTTDAAKTWEDVATQTTTAHWTTKSDPSTPHETVSYWGDN